MSLPPPPSFTEALVERITRAFPALELKPRWIDGIADLPPVLAEHSVFLWSAAERAEPPRLLNNASQVILHNINILIVLSKPPRPSDKESETVERLKHSLRKTLQGWTPPQQEEQRFLPLTLFAGAPVTSARAAREGKKLWLETVQCKHIALTDGATSTSTTTNP